MNNETALVQALVLAVTAPTDEKSKECEALAATFIDLINDTDVVNACYKQAEKILSN